jgi:hypothetical protein
MKRFTLIAGALLAMFAISGANAMTQEECSWTADTHIWSNGVCMPRPTQAQIDAMGGFHELHDVSAGRPGFSIGFHSLQECDQEARERGLTLRDCQRPGNPDAEFNYYLDIPSTPGGELYRMEFQTQHECELRARMDSDSRYGNQGADDYAYTCRYDADADVWVLMSMRVRLR